MAFNIRNCRLKWFLSKPKRSEQPYCKSVHRCVTVFNLLTLTDPLLKLHSQVELEGPEKCSGRVVEPPGLPFRQSKTEMKFSGNNFEISTLIKV